MIIKYFGKDFGGWIGILKFKFVYYFYRVKGNLENGKVLARVWHSK